MSLLGNAFNRIRITTSRPTETPSRLQRVGQRLPLWLALFAGTAALAVLAFFWLGIPDSHTWQLVFSLLTGVVIAAGALALYATAVRRVRTEADSTNFWLAIVLLAGWLLVIWGLAHLIDRFDPGIYERAGYLNSKLSPAMRVTFTYARLVEWQNDFEMIVTWVVLPALVLPFLIETVSRGFGKRSWANAARTLRRWQHWLAVILIGHIGLWLTHSLLHWHPAHSVSGELLSTVLRLGFVYGLDITLFLFVLGIDSELLARTGTQDDIVRDTTA